MGGSVGIQHANNYKQNNGHDDIHQTTASACHNGDETYAESRARASSTTTTMPQARIHATMTYTWTKRETTANIIREYCDSCNLSLELLPKNDAQIRSFA